MKYDNAGECAVDAGTREGFEIDILLDAVLRCWGEDYRRKPRAAVAASIARARLRHGADTICGLLEKLMHDEAVASDTLRALASDAALMFEDSWYQHQVRESLGPVMASFPLPLAWLSQCASTEQLLTLLLMLEESGLLGKTTVYVTHRSARLLAQMREGRVDRERMAEYEQQYRLAGGTRSLLEYGQSEADAFVFSPALLEQVVWSEYNLGTDTSFNEFQWIEARESLLQLDRNARRRALSIYHNSLHHYGVIGVGEAPELAEQPMSRVYRPLREGSPLYRKK